MIERFAYAKINLFLAVEGIREDGYHNILSVMQTVSWADKITLQKTGRCDIHLTCTEPSIPTNHVNTAYRAAQLFLSCLEASMGLHIHIEKNIPSAAGLAGGSADAAAVLLGLNEMTHYPFSSARLLKMGAEIGADVPFCMVGGTKITRGIGDIIEAFPSMPDCHLVCAKLGEGVSTPEAYRAIDEKNDFFKNASIKYGRLDSLRDGFENNDLSHLASGIFNVFEETIERMRPNITCVKETLTKSGARATMMSGSGPSVFGVFMSLEQAEHACAALREMGARCSVCTPVAEFGEAK